MHTAVIRSLTAAILGFLIIGDSSSAPVPKSTPPSADKAKALLLIGKWKLVDCDRPAREPVPDYTIEYGKDGTVADMIGRASGGPKAALGKYTLKNDVLETSFPNEKAGGPERKHKQTILELTETTLHLGLDSSTSFAKVSRLKTDKQ